MPGATPNTGKPYPLPSEPIADGADAIKNLAMSVDGIGASARPSVNTGNLTTAFQVVILPTENFDLGNMHSTTTNTSRMTIPVAGIYVIAAVAAYGGSATAGGRILILSKNANADPALAVLPANIMATDQRETLGTSTVFARVTFIGYFAAGEYVEMFVRSGAPVPLTTESSLAIARVA